jgi:hypothetical protein
MERPARHGESVLRRTSEPLVESRLGVASVTRRFLGDGNDGNGLDERRLGFVGDQLAQERNENEGSGT